MNIRSLFTDNPQSVNFLLALYSERGLIVYQGWRVTFSTGKRNWQPEFYLRTYLGHGFEMSIPCLCEGGKINWRGLTLSPYMLFEVSMASVRMWTSKEHT